MKTLTASVRGITMPFWCCLFLFVSILSNTLHAQVVVAFQGGEPGDTWGYTTNGIGASAAAECMAAPNIKSGTRSIGVGGNTGGGNCWSGGSGNGSSLPHTVTMDVVSIASSSAYTRTLTLSWGNRFPVCNGTGWDSGENLTFRAYHDGVAQPVQNIVNGSNNAAFSIQNQVFTWTIPPCVHDFYFYISVTTNRNDELLFVDDIQIMSPALNPAINQPSAVTGNTTVCQGNTANYSVINVPGTMYSWSNLPTGASFTSANNSVSSSSININWGTAAPGTYSVLVTPSDACGTAPGTAQTVAVTVPPPPTPLSITGPTMVCLNSPITLASNYTADNTWSTGETTSTISVNAPGVYTLTALSACGPLNTSYTVGLNPAANASITPNGPTTFCQGNSVILSSGTPGGANNWSTGESSPTITVTTSGVYTLTVNTVCGTDASTISITVNPTTINPVITASGPTMFCAGDSVLLSSSFATGNSWSTGATTPTIMVHNAGTYTLTVTDVCATASVTQTVVITPSVTAAISASGPTTFCQGGDVVLSSNAPNGNTWSNGATTQTISVNTAGVYTLTVSASCGTATAVQQIIVNPLPTASITAASTAICPGDSVLLTASGGATYLWSTGQTGNSIYVHSAGSYTLAAANGCGTVVSTPVTIAPLSPPNAQISGATQVCAGDALVLTASGGSTYLWSTGATTSTISVSSSGTYTVGVGNSCGIGIASTTISVSTVTANFTADVTTGNAPLAVQFTNSSSSNTVSASWNFGDGGSSTNNAPSHTFTSPGVYTVTLSVQNANGCTDTYTLDILVIANASAIQIPNVFTPNDDHVNDYFTIKTVGINDFHLSIYDRWGKLVMETSDAAKGWDGKSASGNEAADGTYFYIVTAKGEDNKSYEEKGTVNLYR